MIQNIIELSCLSWLIAEGASPAQWLKHRLRIERFPVLEQLLTCSLCTGFWVGLIGTQNILHASLVSVIAEGISRINRKTIL
jgi:hypothetical protein